MHGRLLHLGVVAPPCMPNVTLQCLSVVLRQSETFGGTWFLTLFASRANLRVLTVSAQLACAGEMLAIMTVFELPPRESCKQHMQ